MKSFSYISSQVYTGVFVSRQGYSLCTPFPGPNDNNPTTLAHGDNPPKFGAANLLINWSAYANNVTPPAGAALGVTLNLQSQGPTPAIRRIEGVYVDNSFNTLPVYLVFADTGYMLQVPALAIVCRPVLTASLVASIYCEGFDGVVNPITRVMFMEKFEHAFADSLAVASVVTVPTIESSSHGNNGAGGSTGNFAATLPAGISQGDSLILVVASGPNAPSATPAGWALDNSVIYNNGAPTANGTLQIFTKVASGVEGATVTLNTAQGFLSYACMRIDKFTKGPAGSIASSAFAKNSTALLPTLTPAWGTDTNIWLAISCFQAQNDGAVFNANPASFTQLIDELGASASGFNVRLRIASRLFAGSVLSPGSFGISVNEEWATATYAVGS